jgi:hypothetical protein
VVPGRDLELLHPAWRLAAPSLPDVHHDQHRNEGHEHGDHDATDYESSDSDAHKG